MDGLPQVEESKEVLRPLKVKLHSDDSDSDSTSEVNDELRGAAESFAESRVNIGMSVMS